MSKKLEWMPLHIHRLKASSSWDLPDYLFGQYIRLLVEAADSERPGYLPAASARLKKLARAECSASQFESRNWRALARYFKSTEDGHWIYNERLLEILTEQTGKMLRKRQKPPGASLSLSTVLPDWVPRESWEAFVDSRKKLRRPMTPRAVELIIITLEHLKGEGHDPGAVLDQSIRRGWLDVFPLEQYRRGEVHIRPSEGMKAERLESKTECWGCKNKMIPTTTALRFNGHCSAECRDSHRERLAAEKGRVPA